MKNINKIYIQITASLLIVFALVVYGSPKVFLSSTPNFNPLFVQNIQTVASSIVGLFPYANGTSPALALTEVSKGVYAGEDKITKQKYIKFDKNVKINVTKYTFEGKDIYLYEPEITPLVSPIPKK